MAIYQENYPRELFDLIYIYAKKYSEINNIPLFDVLLNNTPMYFLIGNRSWDIDLESIYWKEFLQKCKKEKDIAQVGYEMYLKNRTVPEKDLNWFGCFRYKYIEDTYTVKIHFFNADETGFGPLALSNYEKRIMELKSMFSDIHKKHPEAKTVQGGSWLYNLNSYKRLFPQDYTQNMRSIIPSTKYLVIWGQFIDSGWKIRKDLSVSFVKRVDNAKTQEELVNCFEFKELFPKGDIGSFYNMYGVK